MRKQDILDQLRQARARLLKAIDGLTPDQMLRPGVIGLWSVKDMLGHLTAWESELVTALSKLDIPKYVPDIVKIEDIFEWNDEQYHINAPRPLDIILEDFHGVHKHLLKTVEELDEKILIDARKFRWMEGEPLSYLIAENAIWHEQEHTEQIEVWRQAQAI